MRNLCGVVAAVALFAPGAAMVAQVSPADPDEFQICAARVWTMAGAPVVDGCVRIAHGRIADVASRSDALRTTLPVVNAPEGELLPGFVDLHSHLALRGDPRRAGEHNERAERVSPDFRILDGFDEYDPAIGHARSGGVTTTLISPGSIAIVSGQSVLMKLKAPPLERMVLRAPAGVKSTSWQPDTYAEIDRWLSEAKAAAQDQSAAATERARIGLALLRRELPRVVHGAYPHGEVEPVLALVDKYNLRLIIYHCESCDENYEELVARKIPIVIGPRVLYWNHGRLTNLASFLMGKGLTVALASDASAGESKYLLEEAGLAMHYGVSKEQALAAITINPARMIGADAHIGSIETGKDADLVLLSGPVFGATTRVERVLIDGVTWYRR